MTVQQLKYILKVAEVGSITVSGKAIGKTIAQKSATKIVHAVAVVLNKLHLNQK